MGRMKVGANRYVVTNSICMSYLGDIPSDDMRASRITPEVVLCGD